MAVENSEKWKDVIGYEGLYKISSHGRVLSLPKYRLGTLGGSFYTKARILKACSDGKYLFVLLYKNKIRRPVHVHRLVAEAFIPNPNNYHVVNHKNEDKLDNNVNNLEWCTQQYNINYGKGNMKRSMSHLKVNKPRKTVWQLSKNGDKLRRFESMCEAARAINGKVCGIQNCASGRTKSYYGYRWQLDV